jgi:hypothetical protein
MGLDIECPMLSFRVGGMKLKTPARDKIQKIAVKVGVDPEWLTERILLRWAEAHVNATRIIVKPLEN